MHGFPAPFAPNFTEPPGFGASRTVAAPSPSIRLAASVPVPPFWPMGTDMPGPRCRLVVGIIGDGVGRRGTDHCNCHSPADSEVSILGDTQLDRDETCRNRAGREGEAGRAALGDAHLQHTRRVVIVRHRHRGRTRDGVHP